MTTSTGMIPPRREKVYVKVNSDIDQTGYMQPRAVIMNDGRRYVIDQVRDFRPSRVLGCEQAGDCYTIVIGGQERHLFFERTSPLFHARIGRWFFEKTL